VRRWLQRRGGDAARRETRQWSNSRASSCGTSRHAADVMTHPSDVNASASRSAPRRVARCGARGACEWRTAAQGPAASRGPAVRPEQPAKPPRLAAATVSATRAGISAAIGRRRCPWHLPRAHPPRAEESHARGGAPRRLMSALPAALVTEHARCKASANRSGRRAFLMASGLARSAQRVFHCAAALQSAFSLGGRRSVLLSVSRAQQRRRVAASGAPAGHHHPRQRRPSARLPPQAP